MMAPVSAGLRIPGMVPTVFEMPMSMAAYFGATSRWLTPNPAQVRPPRPRANDRKTVEVPRDMMSAVRSINIACHRKRSRGDYRRENFHT